LGGRITSHILDLYTGSRLVARFMPPYGPPLIYTYICPGHFTPRDRSCSTAVLCTLSITAPSVMYLRLEFNGLVEQISVSLSSGGEMAAEKVFLKQEIYYTQEWQQFYNKLLLEASAVADF
jgi:hypothetical protein